MLTGAQEWWGEGWGEASPAAEEEEDEELEAAELRRRLIGLVLGRTGALKNAWVSLGGFILVVAVRRCTVF